MAAKEARTYSKQLCFYGSCNEKESKRWLCKCCSLSYCYEHSMPDKHYNLTVNLNSKCQLTTCNEDPDHHPAVVELDDKLVCKPCLCHNLKKKSLQKLDSSCVLSILKTIESLAYTRAPKNIDHLLGHIFGRHSNFRILELEWNIKFHFFLSIIEYHDDQNFDSEIYSNNIATLHHLMKISNCLLDGAQDISIVEAVREKIVNTISMSKVTKRRRFY